MVFLNCLRGHCPFNSSVRLFVAAPACFSFATRMLGLTCSFHHQFDRWSHSPTSCTCPPSSITTSTFAVPVVAFVAGPPARALSTLLF